MLWFFLLSYLTLHYCCISFLWCIHASLTLSLCSFAQTFDNVRFIDPVQNGVWGSDNFYCKGVESGVASGNTFPIPPCFANKTSNWMKTLLYRVPKSQLSSKTGGWLKNVLWTEVWCVCTVKYQYQVYTMKHTNIQRWCIKRYGYIICSFYKIYKIFFLL